MADSFKVMGLGGKKTLAGEIAVGGGKNAVLPAMAASILFDDELRLENVPEIEDVERMRELLIALGVLVQSDAPHTYGMRAKSLQGVLDPMIAEKMRASIILTGPLLARLGTVTFPHPGGCVLGSRPIDLFLEGFQRMGVTVVEENDRYTLTTSGGKLKGVEFFFPLVSVTGTETLMMAAILAKGVTTLRNAAMEPEIGYLAEFLNTCGARIEGAGTPTINIHGGGLLHARGKVYKTMPDRIEAGSFLILGALAAKNLDIVNCNPEHIAILIDMLGRSGVPITVGKDRVSIRDNGDISNRKFKAMNIRTHEYPGFATDLQAPMTVYLTQVTGEAVVFETIFDGRLNYSVDLIKMGADITVFDQHRIRVKGPKLLSGRELEGPDLRAGLAYCIAAIVAKGKSVINNVYHIDRGYERIERRLRDIGVTIERTSSL